MTGLTNKKQGLTKSTLDLDETRLIDNFRLLSELNRGRVLERTESLLNNAK